MDRPYLNKLYAQMARQLDISDTLFDRATISYQALGKYLDNELSDYTIQIYAQGSFNLGTVIKPLTDEDDYDLDLVCEITDSPSLPAYDTKQMIGNALRSSIRYSNKLDEKRRCWRIDYADEAQFHMDITPSIPDEKIYDAIKVTDRIGKNIYEYSPSNPKGYGKWFHDAMEVKYLQLLEQYAFNEKAEIEKVPEHKIKTPLQQAIQILKRHRDITFQDNGDDAPISIIITTLAAKSYTNIDGVYDTLTQIVESMPQYIENRNGEFWVENPTNKSENFAERWNEESTNKATSFFEWINKVKIDLIENPLKLFGEQLNESLGSSLGQTMLERSISEIEAPQLLLESQSLEIISSEPIKMALKVPHRKRPDWNGMPRGHCLGIEAYVEDSSGRNYQYKSNSAPIKRDSRIKFRILGSASVIKPPYYVKWQVVNTGNEAQASNDLRGDFYSASLNTSDWSEHTSYKGIHYVQAFLFKREGCVAQSKEFIVNIE